MKLFHMIRNKDESGVSGTGKVLQGVVFDDGVTVVKWLVPSYSIGIYDTFGSFESAHIDSHPTNDTEIAWGWEWMQDIHFLKVLIFFLEHPVHSFTLAKIEKYLGMTRNTVRKKLRQCEELGFVIKKLGRGPSTYKLKLTNEMVKRWMDIEKKRERITK